MKKAFYFFVLLLSVSSLEGQSASSDKIITQSVADFGKTIKGKKVQLVDVRTPEEFAEGNIQGAANMDVKNENFRSQVAKLDKKRPVAVYCRSGKRSMTAANILSEMGFKKIYNLDGGFLAWKK
jgi:rhodanese-related sulfurtransferase